MQFKLFSISASGDAEAEEELNRFLRAHRVVPVQKELVRDGGGAFWCFAIEYLLVAAGTQGSDRGRSRVDYKQVLSESDFAVFAKLREVRKLAAAEEAVPVYAVCTNEQLAEMAKSRAATVADLKKINGFGNAKAEKYGQRFVTAILDMSGETNEASGQPD